MSNTEKTEMARRIFVLSTFAWCSMDWWCATCPSTHRGHVEFVWNKHASLMMVSAKEMVL